MLGRSVLLLLRGVWSLPGVATLGDPLDDAVLRRVDPPLDVEVAERGVASVLELCVCW